MDGPTDPPAGPSDEYVRLLEEQLRENNRTIQDLVNKQTTPAPAPVVEPPPPDPEELKQRFYADPYNTMRQAIHNELETAIAPLRQFVDRMSATDTYSQLKNKYANDARFTELFSDPDAVVALDQIMAQAEKNDANMQAAIVQVIGLRTLGILNKQPARVAQPAVTTNQPAPTNVQPNGATVVNPPHMRPSGSQNPSNPGAPKRRPLTELEKRLARERFGNSADAEEKYLNFLELAPSDVVRADANGKVAR